jgi:hypothetical protein
VRVAAALADPAAVAFLRKADPVMAQLIDARPVFRSRAWMQELPPLDAFATLIFQVVGQQLSVNATGVIHINDQGIGDEPMAPFCGVKNSGYGKFGGTAGIESFTYQRWVTIQHTGRPV